jgi:hypothetical protein
MPDALDYLGTGVHIPFSLRAVFCPIATWTTVLVLADDVVRSDQSLDIDCGEAESALRRVKE